MEHVEKAGTTFSIPKSSSDYRINLFCLLFFFGTIFFLRHQFPAIESTLLTTICLLATAIPLGLYDLIHVQVHKRPSTGLLASAGEVDTKRLVIKLIGLHGTFLIILILYHLLPVYRSSIRAEEFYNHFFDFLNLLAPWIIVLSFIYFWAIDRRQKDPYDGYWHMGCLLTGRWGKVNKVILQEHARVWFIKGFFTPFMFAVLVTYIETLLAFNWGKVPFLSLNNFLLDFAHTVDVVYGVLGYLLTFRLLDTHIQSTEPTFLGWYVCLACYSPFYSTIGIGLFPYDDGLNWDYWLVAYPFFYYFCAIMIIFCTFIYGLATVAIGYRMSNLTFRGIITSGPYRYTKHPAYIGKVASWWLASLPFLSVEGPMLAFKHTFGLIMVTMIYYLRARTEENHLSNYPEYVEYANWMNEHGLFSFIGKCFPALRYSEEKSKRWNSVVWFKKLSSHESGKSPL